MNVQPDVHVVETTAGGAVPGMPHVSDVRDVRRALRLVARATTPRRVTADHLAANGISRGGAQEVRDLLESLAFVTPTGTPTLLWTQYREGDDREAVLAGAVTAAYPDVAGELDVDAAAFGETVRAHGQVPGDQVDAVVATFRTLCELSGRRPRPRDAAARPHRVVVGDVSRLLQTSVAEFDAARACLERDLTRQAVVSAWASLAALAFAHLSPDDFPTLRTGGARSELAPVELMRSVDDSELVAMLASAGLVDADEQHALELLLERRDDAAHPAVPAPGRDEAAAYLNAVLERAYALTQHPLTGVSAS